MGATAFGTIRQPRPSRCLTFETLTSQTRFEPALPVSDADDYSACCRLAAKGQCATPSRVIHFSSSTSASTERSDSGHPVGRQKTIVPENRIDRIGLLLQPLDLIEAERVWLSAR